MIEQEGQLLVSSIDVAEVKQHFLLIGKLATLRSLTKELILPDDNAIQGKLTRVGI